MFAEQQWYFKLEIYTQHISSATSNFEMAKKAKAAAAAAAAAANGEVFLENKKKKTWVDTKSSKVCFMLYARSLYVTMGTLQHWTWDCFKETSEGIEVVKLSHICWLDVRGKFNVSDLSPDSMYEIAYIVKVTNGGSGWELPITLRLTLPDGKTSRHRQVSLLDKPRGEWFELNVGTFQVEAGETREVCFDILEHGGHWKTGLIIQGAILRPKLI